MFGSEIRVESQTVANLGLNQKQWFELMVEKHNMTGHGGLAGNSHTKKPVLQKVSKMPSILYCSKPSHISVALFEISPYI